ncbi:ABC transporter ATP-binding protein [Arcicella rigui]|uniref:ABC transporter ATP-binding protein n=1 Tax=Arcicella rigui TaxID=797020 RepID=A0ABU5QEM0_9BACT|nr:ABC transporter ATP-binding protein [Arcicella rigui]MEA5141173.1 ABC transporter ATP-binding protein [Arcicella rigui]
MKPIIKVENLSKQYRLGAIGTGTIRNDFKRWWHSIQGKEDPFLKIGETNDRSTKSKSDFAWALKDINFEVMPGEVLGVIGKNGAGKSTLLKILSKVTGPTTGSISYNGRIGSLLEVGTGFHPELSGRENIFLNGAILGMTKNEIRSKLDEIIDFSGCERYIDTPVKRYSSGMTVRLGFAVAAHLEPEILVVDEVLAVGDAEFQKKAIGKMQDVSQKDGRTVLFVSHNMMSIKKLCTTGLLLKNGCVSMSGDISKVINAYELDNEEKVKLDLGSRSDRTGNGSVRITKCTLKGKSGQDTTSISCGEEFVIEVVLTRMLKNVNISDVGISLNICNLSGDKILQLSNDFLGQRIRITNNTTTIQYIIKRLPLNPGRYTIRAFISDRINILDWIEHVFVFDVEEGDFFGSGVIDNSSIFFTDHSFKIIS